VGFLKHPLGTGFPQEKGLQSPHIVEIEVLSFKSGDIPLSGESFRDSPFYSCFPEGRSAGADRRYDYPLADQPASRIPPLVRTRRGTIGKEATRSADTS
jgi:hypothetical protein